MLSLQGPGAVLLLQGCKWDHLENQDLGPGLFSELSITRRWSSVALSSQE